MTISLARACRLLYVILGIIAVDMLSKYLTYLHVPLMVWSIPIFPYGGIPIFKNFLGIDLVISHITNRGGPGGIISSHHQALVLLRVFAVGCIIAHLLFFNKIAFRQIPLCMVIGGAIGNIVDSFFYGHVIDMIHFTLWGYSCPIFNIADASITIGVAMMLVHACIQKYRESKRSQDGGYSEESSSIEEPFEGNDSPY